MIVNDNGDNICFSTICMEYVFNVNNNKPYISDSLRFDLNGQNPSKLCMSSDCLGFCYEIDMLLYDVFMAITPLIYGIVIFVMIKILLTLHLF